MSESRSINMEDFCSRKLWEMVSQEKSTTPDELQAAIEELAQRRHYLSELEQLGKLTPKT